MDTITHGIAGALIGKGFFSRKAARVVVFSATVGAMFPDIDVVAEIFSRDPLAIVKYHRAITHSFIALPFFGVGLEFLTREIVAFLRQNYPRFAHPEPPAWGLLTIIYAVAIASHILLDAIT